MRFCIYAILFATLIVGGDLGSSRSFAQQAIPRSSSNSPPGPARDNSTDLAAIREASQAFVAAFDKQDARALASHWTEEGEFVDDSGLVFKGRKVIENEYARFFAENPGHKLRLTIDSLKLVSDTTAIEDGRATLEPAPLGPPAINKYMAVHIKVGGKWLMSSVRDTRIETTPSKRVLDDLEWLVGTWTAEEHGAKNESVCRWIANKSFLERVYTITQADGTTSSGVQLIGFNPQGGHLQSWNFSSDGGHATGVWTPQKQGWSIELYGIAADGANTTAVNMLDRLDDNAYSWQAVQRTADGVALPDTNEIVLKRRTSSR